MKFIENTKDYFKNVKIEMQKVNWPTKDEIKGSTGVVIVTVAILGFYVGLVDLILSSIVGLLIR